MLFDPFDSEVQYSVQGVYSANTHQADCNLIVRSQADSCRCRRQADIDQEHCTWSVNNNRQQVLKKQQNAKHRQHTTQRCVQGHQHNKRDTVEGINIPICMYSYICSTSGALAGGEGHQDALRQLQHFQCRL